MSLQNPQRHGETANGKRSTEYNIWMGMLDRCRRKTFKQWRDYGGRGVTVCERWESFELFLEDMGRRPSPKHSLDRYPNKNGNYGPDNCRWATTVEQCNNKRNNVLITFRGKTQTVELWCEELGIKKSTVWARLWKGWDIESALTASTTGILIELNGKSKTLSEWATHYRINKNFALLQRRRGVPITKILKLS